MRKRNCAERFASTVWMPQRPRARDGWSMRLLSHRRAFIGINCVGYPGRRKLISSAPKPTPLMATAMYCLPFAM